MVATTVLTLISSATAWMSMDSSLEYQGFTKNSFWNTFDFGKRFSRVQCQASINVWEIEKSDSYYYEKMELPDRAKDNKSHVLFGPLWKNGCIERYDVYKRINLRDDNVSNELILADIYLGRNLCGHNGIVHGGIIATLLDDTMGMAFGALGIDMALTANLNVNFRHPVRSNSPIVIRVRCIRREERKLFFSAQLTNPEGSILYAEATTLYIIPKLSST
jgi:acyl-coenzyme A thioesterase PaaI-like protein